MIQLIDKDTTVPEGVDVINENFTAIISELIDDHIDLLGGVGVNDARVVNTDPQSDAPFAEPDYSIEYVQEMISSSGQVVTNVILIDNGTYKFKSDDRHQISVYLYDPYNGCYDAIEHILSSNWVKNTDGDYVYTFEIDTEYEYNYIRVAAYVPLSTWNGWTITLERTRPERTLVTDKDLIPISNAIAQNVSDITSISSQVTQNVSDITAANAQIAQNTADITTANAQIALNTTDITTASAQIAQNTTGIAGIKEDASDLNIRNKEIKTIDDASVPAYVGTKTNGIITQTHTGSGNHWWTILFENTDVSSGFVRVKTTVDELEGQIQVYLFAKDATTGNQYYIPIRVIDEIGTYIIDIDLNYYVVYKNIDLNQQMKIGFANKESELRAVYTFASLYDATNDLEGTMAEVINTVNRKADSAINAASANIDVKLTDNNGDKYLVQVSNGNVVAVPLLPSNILYIGNSLLTGNGTFGMAASNSSEDYYHYVNTYLTEQGKTVNAVKLRGVDFEICTTTSAQESFMTDTLLPQLNNNLDLVIIQLGDNVNNEDRLAVFPDGAKAFVRYIRTHAPNARVAWVCEWYHTIYTTAKQTAIANACAEYGATFVDINDLYTAENRAAIGDVITYDDGTTTTIDSPGVASHPSSVGMRAIADRIIERLF